jgi:predicted O-methyltransferase YrrM
MSGRTKLEGAYHLVRTYLTAAPSVIYRVTASVLLDPKGTQSFLHHVLERHDLQDNDPFLGSVDITDLLPAPELIDAKIIGPFYSRRTSDTRSLFELASLAYLIQAINPALIFEIGTFVGRTTRLFAMNSSESCRVITLDLDQDKVPHRIGEAFLGKPEEDRIAQLHGDSLTFDFSPWFKKCDFVWIDACHDYQYVEADTKTALQIVKPGGWIAWHDYRHSAWWSGVTRCVKDMRSEYPLIKHLRGTTIAVLKAEADQQ